MLATFLVFTFVALWHDLSFRLLAWGWLVTLFIIPEITARALVPEKKVSVGAARTSVELSLGRQLTSVRRQVVVPARRSYGWCS